MTKAQTPLTLYENHHAHRVWLGNVDLGGWHSQIHLQLSDVPRTLCGIDMTPKLGKWWSDLYWDETPLEDQVSCLRCLKSVKGKRFATLS